MFTDRGATPFRAPWYNIGMVYIANVLQEHCTRMWTLQPL